MAALGSGFFMAFALVDLTLSTARGSTDYWGAGIMIGISLALFIIGGRKAEKLWEQP